jgi:hypothetical protein
MIPTLCTLFVVAVIAGLIVLAWMLTSSDVEVVETEAEPHGDQVDIKQFYKRWEDRL